MAKDSNGKAERQLKSVRGLASDLADKLDLNASLRLWDGSRIPLGANVTGPFEISIAGPGVIGALLRRPTLDNFIRHYVEKDIDFSGGTLIDLGSQLNRGGRSVKLKGKEALGIAMKLAPFLLTRADKAQIDQGFAGEITGRARKTADNKDYIQFHYDLSNEFYALFLDPEMVYSCAYYTDWHERHRAGAARQARDDLPQAALEARRALPRHRVRLGWAHLSCGQELWRHRAWHHAVGSAARLCAREDRAAGARRPRDGRAQGLLGDGGPVRQDRLHRHVRAHRAQEHPRLHEEDALAADRGWPVPQSRDRAAGAEAPGGWPSARCGPRRALSRNTSSPAASSTTSGIRLSAMERAGFEVQDVEGWRLHYARTCQLWCERLTAKRERPSATSARKSIASGSPIWRACRSRFLAARLRHVPDAGLQVGEAAARAAAHPRRSLPVKPCGGIWVLKTGHLNAGRDSFGRSAFDPKRTFDTVTRSKGRPNFLRPGVEPYIAARL